MTISVYGDLNRAVAHLVFHLSQGSAVLDQQTSEGVT
jgi:virulence-associated protein VapD